MNQELALKLKVAGFPQERPIMSHCCHWWFTEPDGSFVMNPTLEELIEACCPDIADDFNLNLQSGIWEACLIYHGYFEGWIGMEREDGFVSIDERIKSKTPEEAVANLWLALNSK